LVKKQNFSKNIKFSKNCHFGDFWKKSIEMMTWTVPMTWNDKVHDDSAMVEEGRGCGIELDGSKIKIT
jgi:hypothetical protein